MKIFRNANAKQTETILDTNVPLEVHLLYQIIGAVLLNT
jgi:hypothetical protein